MIGATDVLAAAADLARAGVAGIVSVVELGGPVAAVLLVLSVVALAVILAKLAELARGGVGRRGAAERALRLWQAGRRAAAAAELEGQRPPTARALAHAMREAGRRGPGDELLRESVVGFAGELVAGLRSHLRALELIVEVAPLLGLFGTVLGMIDAFQALHQGGADVDPAALAGGIWVALVTTAVGLGLAIPVSMILAWFEARIDAERLALESLLTAFLTGSCGVAAEAADEAPMSSRLSHAD